MTEATATRVEEIETRHRLATFAYEGQQAPTRAIQIMALVEVAMA